ncbi:uncharacterized protein LOC121777056 isoform X1 [Salvia splendens]|uniref:uncharacterized protein LOC121777056 isoform X1 n=1 Tax=Salvia splendens TaxID=180675 RepID=UPI001C280378|nr:uncharacterized protein LOC121777056 isoform X1 [Salvia splendens]
MGRFLQLPYVKEDSMAQHVVTRYGVCSLFSGVETPRNSRELPEETFYGLYAGRDRKLYSYNSFKESPKKTCSTEAPMKKLISEEISKKSNARPNAPSLVARLMGVDMLPVDLGQEPKMIGRMNDVPARKFTDKEQSRKSSDGRDSFIWDSPPQHGLDYFDRNFDSFSDHCSSHMKLGKPKRREHPQEKELQNFKKEFEAWQAARIMECSKVVEFKNSRSQTMMQDELSEETKFCYDDCKRVKSFDNLKEPKDLPVRLRETLASRNCEKKRDHLLDGMKESLFSNKSKRDIPLSNLLSSDKKSDIVSAPTKIVVLRPGPDRMGVNEDSWNSTPSSFEERGSIQNFLEEVKERLKSELQGKSSKKSKVARGGGIETPYREKPSEPRQIAHRIAQQVRDSVTQDIGLNLLRSESTRSYISDTQSNGTDSPELVNRETRKLLTERFRNVLKGETHREIPIVSHKRQRSSVLNPEKTKAVQSRDILIENKVCYPESSMNDLGKQNRSFREAPDDCRMLYKEPSPRNLVRSLSAPVSGSGTSLGKLLLEDRHIFTGAQIRMKHEVVENVSMDVKKQKNEKSKIREKVSSFGYSLTLRGRLFRRRVQSVDELHYNCDDLLKDIASGPTVMMNSYDTHENSTEVPPSPASVCSNVDDENWRPAVCSSPASSGADQPEDSEVPYVFSPINPSLNDSVKQLDQLEKPGLEESITEEKSDTVDPEIKDPTEAYVRDLLVASGYYDGSCSRPLPKWDPLSQPISNQVFEEVEESYTQITKVDESSTKDEGARTDHRVILDLLNEALQIVLKQPPNMSRLGKAIESSRHQAPRGRELLSFVWEIIQGHVHPPAADRSTYALESMLARDLKSDSWPRLLDDDVNDLGKDVECHITCDLIEEIVKDIYSLHT